MNKKYHYNNIYLICNLKNSINYLSNNHYNIIIKTIYNNNKAILIIIKVNLINRNQIITKHLLIYKTYKLTL
jgi:hypothetical protein